MNRVMSRTNPDQGKQSVATSQSSDGEEADEEVDSEEDGETPQGQRSYFPKIMLLYNSSYTIKGNESHREISRMSKIFNFEISTPHSGNSEKLLFINANPIRIGYLVTEL